MILERRPQAGYEFFNAINFGSEYEAEHQDKTHTLNRRENYKFVLENKILDAGTEILYESSICGIYMEDDTVIGVKVITPDGLADFGVKVLMDCTADAYVAYMAGCSIYG